MNKFPVKVVISIVGIAVTAILVCFLHSVSIPSQSSYYIEQTGECYCLVSPDLGSLGQEAGKQIVEVLNEWKDLTETYTQMALAALNLPQ